MLPKPRRVLCIRLAISLCFLALTVPFPVSQMIAAELSYRQFTSSDGLPSDELHDIVQGPDGKLWIASDNGLCSYDGYQFRSFTTKNGLTDNTFFRVVQDRAGLLWLQSFGGGLSLVNNGKFEAAPGNHQLLELLGDSFVVQLLIDDDHGPAWSASKDGRVFELDIKSGHVQKVDLVDRSKLFQSQLIELGNGAGLLSLPSPAIPVRLTNKPILERRDFGWSVDNWSESSTSLVHRMVNGEILWFDTNRALHIAGDTLYAHYSYPHSINRVLELDSSTIWCASFGGVYELDIAEMSVPQAHYLQEYIVTSICRDHEGNIWLTTLRNGLLMVANRNVRKLPSPFERGEVVACAGRNDTLILASTLNEIAILETSDASDWSVEIHDLHIRERPLEKTPAFVEFVHNKIHTGLSFYNMNNGRVELAPLELLKRWPLAAATAKNADVWFSGNGFLQWRDTAFVFKSSDIGFSERTICIHVDGHGDVHAGTLNGLVQYIDGRLIAANEQAEPLRSRINDIAETADGALWFASKGEGVLRLHDGVLQQFTTNEGLNSDLCSRVCIDHSTQEVWVADNSGLSRIRGSAEDDFEIERFGTFDGLPRGQIVDMCLSGGKLFIVSRSGVSYFDPGLMLTNTSAPIVRIDKLSPKGRAPQSSMNQLVLTPDSNDIEITYTAHSFRRRSDPIYRYQMHAYDAAAVETQNRSVRYTDLPAGDYRFELAASNEGRTWSSVPTILNIRVLEHFTEELWFQLLCLGAFIALLSLLVWGLVRRQHNIEVTKRHMIDVEYRSLRLQMNPHFLFNALNSVKYLIISKQTDAAGRYLSQFSRLIRTILDHSRRRTVPLQAELQSVRDFLALEQLRYKDRLTYEIDVDANLHVEELYIAPMLLQPLLENAVQHGIMPRRSPGHVTLTLRQIPGGFSCIVEDDGIGRVQALAERRKQRPLHQSTALENIEERLKLVNALGGSRYVLKIEDLYNEAGDAAGTKVEIIVKEPVKHSQ